MSDTVANAEVLKPLSQVERVVDTFTAPSKTFTDILRDASWWLPWLLSVLVTLGFGLAIQQKVGWDKAYANILLHSPQAQQDRMSQLPPDQQAKQKVLYKLGCAGDRFTLGVFGCQADEHVSGNLGLPDAVDQGGVEALGLHAVPAIQHDLVRGTGR